ncbi:MAG: hypothetical protein K2L49_04880, partial [Muribaculaceae bacterium]|nr:hypothetical protein [Muribaculaceae bacterium]
LVACESVGYDPLWLCRVLDLMYSWITGVASEVGAWPGSSVAGIYFRPWLLIPYFAVVAMIGMSLWRRRLFYLVGGVMIAAAAWLITTIIPYGDDVQREWYIARRTYRTDIVMRDAHRAYLITTAPRHQIASVAEECRMIYAGYIGMRGIDSLEVVDDSFVGQGLERSGRLVMFGNKVMIIVTSADDMRKEPMRHVDYAVVCRGFTGDVTDAGNILHADTVILSKDLHARRHDRYMEELRACGIPVVSLRDGSFRRVLSR